MAVGQTQQQCEKGGYTFETESNRVQNKLLSSTSPIFTSSRLIAAKPYFSNVKKHAEYSLLTDDRMNNLLNGATNECVVFYSYYSPCLDRCLNADDGVNIINLLHVFNKINDNKWKAFVFTHQVFEGFRSVSRYIPIFRCTKTECFDCMENQNVDKNKYMFHIKIGIRVKKLWRII
uniref:Uncharacterized protein n=1 Tax=Esox lucius TaxID=8010 RepID=A0A6Q2ZAT7_ESOLU